MIQVGCTYLMSSSEWADEWVMSLGLKILNTKESKIHHPLISPLTTCSEGMYNPPASLSLKSNSTLTFMPTAVGMKHP